MDTKDLVRAYIVENMLLAGGGEDLENDSSLLSRGILDSTGVLELVMFIEETFELKVADSEMIPENLDSLDGIAAFVARKQSSKGKGAP